MEGNPSYRSEISAGERGVAIGGNVNGGIIVTGNLLIQYITAPIRRLPTDYASHVEDFLHLYLGTLERPVPFGGRDDALRALDAWLEDPDRPYALLSAPAGRGKSALVVRWLTAVKEQKPAWPIVFMPISVRFGTNFAGVTFSALTAQLARAFEEDVPTDTSMPEAVWRGMFRSYLSRVPSNGRLLVVLDGIDEAANWDVNTSLFPLQPPAGLKVLLSTRLTADRPHPQDWQRALGWERLNVHHIDLEPLDRPGLHDVLEKMGVLPEEPDLRPAIVAELHRLTEGDPLLVNLYVSHLIQQREGDHRLCPADLRLVRPGYEGYFDCWGDGYVFAHPRLAEYFRSKLAGPERCALERRFLEWGGRTLEALAEGRLEPRQTPSYLVRCYRAHLEGAAAPLADMGRLVETHAWAQAGEALEGSWEGYLGVGRHTWTGKGAVR